MKKRKNTLLKSRTIVKLSTRKLAEKYIIDFIMKEGIAGFLQLRGACASCAIDGNLEAGQALIAMKKIPFDKSTSDKNIVELGKLCHACCLK